MLIYNYKYQAVNALLSGVFMVIVDSPRRHNQPGSFSFIRKVTTLIQDTLCVRENVRLYNCCGLVSTVYFVVLIFRDETT